MPATVFVEASVDGLIARRDGGIGWPPHDAEEHGYTEFMSTVDA